MYYIEKEGVYKHGVFWIGDDLYKGIGKLMKLAQYDEDGYHRWVINEYLEGNNCDTIMELSKYQQKPQHLFVGSVVTTEGRSVVVHSGKELLKEYLEDYFTVKGELTHEWQ